MNFIDADPEEVQKVLARGNRMKNVVCKSCSLVFKTKTWRVFCSKPCWTRFSRSVDYIKTRKIVEKVSCFRCGNKVYKRPCLMKFKRNYCSRNCHNLSQKASSSTKCFICGTFFKRVPSQKSLSGMDFCSKRCAGISISIRSEIKVAAGIISPKKAIRYLRRSKTAEDWRKKVFFRDKYTCQICKKVGGYLQADHIKPFAYFPDLRFDISNGRTLCRDCHKKTDTFGYKARKKYEKKVY